MASMGKRPRHNADEVDVFSTGAERRSHGFKAGSRAYTKAKANRRDRAAARAANRNELRVAA